MDCPYCHKLMQAGRLKFVKNLPYWQGDGEHISALEAELGQIGQPTALERKLFGNALPGHYCSSCKKLIIETEFTK